jgi:hypothetical protein
MTDKTTIEINVDTFTDRNSHFARPVMGVPTAIEVSESAMKGKRTWQRKGTTLCAAVISRLPDHFAIHAIHSIPSAPTSSASVRLMGD